MSADPDTFAYGDYVTPEVPRTEYALSTYEAVDPAKFTKMPPVYIDDKAIDEELEKNFAHYTTEVLPPDWAQTYHYTATDFADRAQAEQLCQYVFVLDALNFCFWPLQGYEYEHLASSLKQTLTADPAAFSAASLMALTEAQLAQWLQPPKQFPLVSSEALPAATPGPHGYRIPLLAARTRLLREVGAILDAKFGGKAYNMIASANQSALALMRIVTSNFPGFRDHLQWAGDQVFFYKRAQIFVGDVWGAFAGKHIGTFTDMHMLTCFADYRIPQLFRGLGILKFRDDVAARVEALQEMPAGSEEEVCVRATTVQAVEAIRRKMAAKGHTIHAFQLDWLLWEAGEKLMKEGKIVPHHRTITTYY
jgi:hypothetical protein